MNNETWSILIEAFKALTPIVMGIIAYFVNQLSKSLRTMEHDINEIKIGLNLSSSQLDNIKERMAQCEQEQREQVKAWTHYWQNYGAMMERLKEERK
jgi:predicted metalloenzyme YecM